MEFWPRFVRSQWLTQLPYPTATWAGKTVIVTGSNTGMGLEAARHFVRLDASRVILAVRNQEKGDAAKTSIERSTGRVGVAEVWQLDLESKESVKKFAARAQELERLDVVVENAGVFIHEFELVDGNESNVTINVINTMLLALLLLPKLRKTSVDHGTEAVLTFTGSFVHFLTQFPERNADDIFEELNRKEKANMADRYNVTKMILLLLVRELANQLIQSQKSGRVITSLINPGFVLTEIMRRSGWGMWAFIRSCYAIGFVRTAEWGGRTLVNAAEGGSETMGAYMDDCRPAVPSAFVTSDEGMEVQKKLWFELARKMDTIQPGIMKNI